MTFDHEGIINGCRMDLEEFGKLLWLWRGPADQDGWDGDYLDLTESMDLLAHDIASYLCKELILVKEPTE